MLSAKSRGRVGRLECGLKFKMCCLPLVNLNLIAETQRRHAVGRQQRTKEKTKAWHRDWRFQILGLAVCLWTSSFASLNFKSPSITGPPKRTFCHGENVLHLHVQQGGH